MAAYSNILAWKISWTQELAGCSPWDLERIGYDLATKQQQ